MQYRISSRGLIVVVFNQVINSKIISKKVFRMLDMFLEILWENLLRGQFHFEFLARKKTVSFHHFLFYFLQDFLYKKYVTLCLDLTINYTSKPSSLIFFGTCY